MFLSFLRFKSPRATNRAHGPTAAPHHAARAMQAQALAFTAAGCDPP